MDVRSALGVGLECRDEFALEAVPVDTQLVQRAVVVFGFIQRQQDVFGADVVVTEPKCLAERQLQHLFGLAVERNQHGYVVDARRQRDGLINRVDVDPLGGEQLDRESFTLGEQR